MCRLGGIDCTQNDVFSFFLVYPALVLDLQCVMVAYLRGQPLPFKLSFLFSSQDRRRRSHH